MNLASMPIETYADTIRPALTNVEIADVDGVTVTSATHPERGPIVIMQAFPGDKVLIFERQVTPAIAA